MDILRRVLIFAVVGSLLAVAWNRARTASADPEQLIWWQIEEMVDGFNEGRPWMVGRSFHRGFKDLDAGYGREELQAALGTMLGHGPPRAEGGRFRILVLEESFSILEEQADPPSASVRLEATIYRKDQEGWVEWWSLAPRLEFSPSSKGIWRVGSAAEIEHATRPRL